MSCVYIDNFRVQQTKKQKNENRELCFENLAFMCEILQFKNELIKKIKEKHTHEEIGKLATNNCNVKSNPFGVEIELPRNVPLSSIVFGKDDNENLLGVHEQAVLLFKKYIQAGEAPLEINIGYFIRQTLMSYFDKLMSSDKHINDGSSLKEKVELVCCFDEAIKEVSNVLRHCYARFIKH